MIIRHLWIPVTFACYVDNIQSCLMVGINAGATAKCITELITRGMDVKTFYLHSVPCRKGNKMND